jgi:hypothetical protein
MGLLCFRRDRALSRLLDGELGDGDRERLEAHAAACPRCTSRLEGFRSADAFLAGRRVVSMPAAPVRLAFALAAAAALVASLAANLSLPAEPVSSVFTVEAGPSQALHRIYARLAEPKDTR